MSDVFLIADKGHSHENRPIFEETFMLLYILVNTVKKLLESDNLVIFI